MFHPVQVVSVLLLALSVLVIAQEVVNTGPTYTDHTKILAPIPKISCGTCRTATSITLDWEHMETADVPVTFYNVYWRIKRLPGTPQEKWSTKRVDTWEDVIVQVTVGCCTGCETDVQNICSLDNLQSSTMYEIVAESVYVTLGNGNDRNDTMEYNPSAPLDIPTGQNGQHMPKIIQTPTSTHVPIETICSLIGVCSQLQYDDTSRPLQTMITEQQILTMDKAVDEEGKIGGYDNIAAIAFFEKYKISDGTNDIKYVVSGTKNCFFCIFVFCFDSSRYYCFSFCCLPLLIHPSRIDLLTKFFFFFFSFF